MSITIANFARSVVAGSVVTFGVFASQPLTLAQVQGGHFEHHHLILGLDSLQVLTSGTYSGLANPNYNRLSLLFPHLHDPISTSGFHSLGIYTYTGDVTSPTIMSTSTNNNIPETRSNLPPLSLFSGSGVFTGRMVSQKTDANIYSDLKIRPVAHLADDLDDPFVQAIYNSGNGRWQSLLGDEATIALELVSSTPGLSVTNSQGDLLFTNNTYTIGVGDDFSFTPVFSVADNSPITTYSATFRFIDVNTANGRTPLLPSGTFTVNFSTSCT